MITLRHHVLTIVAVFLALAAGIVLGGGPLSDVGPTVATAAGRGGHRRRPADRAQADYTEAFAPRVGRLRSSGGWPTARSPWSPCPGADEQVVTALTEQVAAAGGTVSGPLRPGRRPRRPRARSRWSTRSAASC